MCRKLACIKAIKTQACDVLFPTRKIESNSHLLVSNKGPLDWESSALTTRLLKDLPKKSWFPEMFSASPRLLNF